MHDSQYLKPISWEEWALFIFAFVAGVFLDLVLFVRGLVVTDRRLPDEELPVDLAKLKELEGKDMDIWWKKLESMGGARVLYGCVAVTNSYSWPILHPEPGTAQEMIPCVFPEEEVTEIVRAHTTIPVPRTVGHLTDSLDVIPSYKMITYIKGPTLFQAWPSLSVFCKLWVVLTLRRYVKELRQVHQPYSGPVCLPCRPDVEKSWLLQHLIHHHLFYDCYNDLKDWFRTTSGHGYEDPKPLVLCHADLHMSNIIFGDDGQLWLIDWETSGFYPQWFERKLMSWHPDPTWNLVAAAVCGYDPWSEHWWNIFRNTHKTNRLFRWCKEDPLWAVDCQVQR